MNIQLNPALDVEQLADQFKQDRKIRVNDILTAESADYILENLQNATAWHLVHSDAKGSPICYKPAELDELSSQDLQNITAGLISRAANSYQFIYKYFPMIQAIQENTLPEASMLYKASMFLNSSEFISFARKLTSDNSLVKIDPQASLYEGGHFLNVHDDMSDKRDSNDTSTRHFAVVLGFTKNWSANWGGQTSFFKSPVDPISESWAPTFNSMTVFEVPSLHCVDYVTPFAPKGRYSITGWLRADPNITRTDLGDT